MTQWITEIVSNLSYTGIALLMLAENVVPPIPSEVVMPAGGFAASKGELSWWGVILAGTVGSLAGALPWYYLGRWLGEDRLRRFAAKRGKWIGMREKDIDKSVKWFDRHGSWAVLLCRLVPGVRTLISLPAGFARMDFWKFMGLSAIGTIGWNALLVGLGWLLRDQYKRITDYMGWISLAVIVLLVGWFIFSRFQRSDEEELSGAGS